MKTQYPKFIIESFICKKCQAELNQVILDLEMGTTENIADNDDSDFVPLQSMVDDNQKAKAREQLDTLTSIFQMDRIRFQANKDLDTMSRRSLSYFRDVHKEMEEKLTDTFCSLIAPGQKKKLRSILSSKNPTEEDESFVIHLKDAPETCSTRKAIYPYVSSKIHLEIRDL